MSDETVSIRFQAPGLDATVEQVNKLAASLDAIAAAAAHAQRSLAATGRDTANLKSDLAAINLNKKVVSEGERGKREREALFSSLNKQQEQIEASRARTVQNNLKQEEQKIAEITALYKERDAENKLQAKEQLALEKEINKAYAERALLHKTPAKEIDKGYAAAAALRGKPLTGAQLGGSLSALEEQGLAQTSAAYAQEEARRVAALKNRMNLRKLAAKEELDAIAKVSAAQKLADTQAEAAKKKLAREARALAVGARGGGGFNLIGAAVSTAIAVSTIKQVAELSDHYTTLRNRIALVTTSDLQREQVMKRIVSISVDTRTSLDATAQIFQRLATSAGGLKISYNGMLGIVESLNKAVVVGGSNFVEAEKGLLQLSQGMARGQLRGDELRSVLEQLPGVAEVLATHFGRARGELYWLAAQGKITPKEIISAFQEAKEYLDKKFALTIPTIAQSFGILQTKIIEFLGTSDNMQSITAKIAVALKALAANLDTVARVLASGAIYLGLTKVFNILSSLALLTTSGGGLVSLFGKAGLLFFAQSIAFDETASSVDTLNKALTDISNWTTKHRDDIELVLTTLASAALAAGIAAMAVEVYGLATAFTVLGATEAFAALLNPAIAIPLIAALSAGVAIASVTHTQQQLAAQAARTQARNKTLSPMSGHAISKDDALSLLDAEIKGGDAGGGPPPKTGNKRTFADYLQDARDALDVLKEQGRQHSINAGLLKVTHGLKRQLTADEEALMRVALQNLQTQREMNALTDLDAEFARNQRLGVLRGDARAQQEAIYSYNDKAGITDEEAALPGAREKAATLALVDAQTARYQSTLDSLLGTQVEFAQNQVAINQAFAAGKIDLQQYEYASKGVQEQMLATSLDWRSGVQRGVLELQKHSLDSATSIQRIFTSSFDAAGDAILEFCKTGKLNIEDLVTDILSQLARLAIQNAIITPLATAFGNVFKANPTAVATNEGFVPTTGGDTAYGNPNGIRNVAYGVTPQQQQATVVQVNHVNYAPGVETRTERSTGSNGEDILTMVTRAVSAKQLEDTNYGAGLETLLKQRGLRHQGMHR